MKKKGKYIKIFALTLLFMISISFNAEVRAETNYFDENGVMYRLIFDDTQLKNFVQRDFTLYYNEKDLQNEDIAKLQQTTQSGSYNYSLGFAKNKKLNMIIFEFSEEWQKNNNEKYIAIILPDYIAGNNGAINPRIYDDVRITKGSSGDYNFYVQGFQKSGYGLEMLNFNKNESGVSEYKNGESAVPGNSTLNIIIDKNGNIQRVNDMWNKNSTLMDEINTNTKKNIIYSSLDIWNWQLTEIVKPKEDFEQRKDIIVEKEIKVNTDESNEINFKIYNLKKNDKVKIIKKDKNGNYTESDIVEETITIDLNENQSYLIKDENIKENKIYDIKVYNSKNEIIYNEEYIHSMKDYVLEDKSEEKNKLINLENYKINNKLASMIKNVFIIANREYLGKIVFLVFTITIITIIRKMV